MTKTVAIRVDEKTWDLFKQKAKEVGYSRNKLINLFIESIVIGASKIETHAQSTNVIVNLVQPIQVNANIKAQKERLLNKAIEGQIRETLRTIHSIEKNNGVVPVSLKNKLLKFIQKSNGLPEDLSAEVEKVFAT
jgi:antitoxin component of RelBE/YafQ-DinJ toxin-antitoxin module